MDVTLSIETDGRKSLRRHKYFSKFSIKNNWHQLDLIVCLPFWWIECVNAVFDSIFSMFATLLRLEDSATALNMYIIYRML